MSRLRKDEHQPSPELHAIKDEALLLVAKSLRDELDRRISDGTFAKDLGKMKLEQLTRQLTNLAEVLKGPAIQIGLHLPAPVSQERLRFNSGLKRDPSYRTLLHNRADKKLAAPAQDAEVIEPEKPTQ